MRIAHLTFGNSKGSEKDMIIKDQMACPACLLPDIIIKDILRFHGVTKKDLLKDKHLVLN